MRAGDRGRRGRAGEFGALRLGGDGVAGHRRGEAALRAEREPFGIDQGTRLTEPGLDPFRRLDPRGLGGDQAQHHDLVIGDQPQRVEGAGALVVVFQQQPVGVNTAEYRGGDRVVPAGHQPGWAGCRGRGGSRMWPGARRRSPRYPARSRMTASVPADSLAPRRTPSGLSSGSYSGLRPPPAPPWEPAPASSRPASGSPLYRSPGRTAARFR
jgi:hypothetical protein